MLEKLKQIDIKNDIISSQKRCMRMLTETDLVGSKINVALKEQGETLVQSQVVTTNIQTCLKRSDKDIRVLKAWYGGIINKIRKPVEKGNNKIRSMKNARLLRRTNSGSLPNLNLNDHSSAHSSFSEYSAPIGRQDERSENGFENKTENNNGSDPLNGFDCQLLHYSRSIEEAKLHCDLNEELVIQSDKEAVKDTVNGIYKRARNLMFMGENGADNVDMDEEIETNFSHMSSCLSNLKKMGMDMQEELDIQTHMIGQLHGAIDKTDENTEDVIRAMRHFEV